MQGLQHQPFQSAEPVLLHQISHQCIHSHEWQWVAGILQHIKYREKMLTKPRKLSSFSSICAWHFEDKHINNYLNKAPVHILFCHAKLEPTHNIKSGDTSDITIMIVFVVHGYFIHSSELGYCLSSVSSITSKISVHSCKHY